MIWKWIKVILTGVLVSMFFFPFEFTALPGVNTKMMMAALGVVLFLLLFIYKREFSIPRELLILLLGAAGVSIVALVSTTCNQTPDNTYVSYILSAAVWISAAFVVCSFIRMAHGKIDVLLVVNYLVGICVFQCVIALLIEFIPSIGIVVDRFIEMGQAGIKDMGRLYGIGAALDVAGGRFSCVLVSIAALVDLKKNEISKTRLFIYLMAFALITIIGNMIARTTLVGVGLSVFFWGIRLLQSSLRRERKSGELRIISIFALVLCILVPATIVLYNYFPEAKELIRFAFEGFFSLFEKGEWEVSSNGTLSNMVVFPKTLETWIIGDGYFINPRYDINYLGSSTSSGYYMGTDIGYLRFIFYFGVIGLVAMSLVILYAAHMCAKAFPEYKVLFWLVCLVNFIVWFKVSTDVFLFFCLFICASIVQQEFPEDGQDDAGTDEISTLPS